MNVYKQPSTRLGKSLMLPDFLGFFSGKRSVAIITVFMSLFVALIYYFVFRFCITKFNLKTPGREDDNVSDEEMTATLTNNDYTGVAKEILAGIGGKANITSIDNCVTRLRLEVKDYTQINEKKIKAAGARGIIRPSKTSVQIIIGTQVQFVADEMKKLVK